MGVVSCYPRSAAGGTPGGCYAHSNVALFHAAQRFFW